MAAKQAAWVGSFLAIAPLVFAAGVIAYQLSVGCRVKSLGDSLRLEFFDCPVPQPVRQEAERAYAPGNLVWSYDGYRTSCNIPILNPGDAKNLMIGAAASAIAKMNSSVIPYGDDNVVYTCHIRPSKGTISSAADPSIDSPYISYVEKTVSFKNQGRSCGILSFRADYEHNGTTVPGHVTTGKFCMQDGKAFPVMD